MPVPEMTCAVSGRMLNLTRSLTIYFIYFAHIFTLPVYHSD